MAIYRVIVSKEVAALGGGGGTRRRTVQTPQGPRTLTFSQHPTFLDGMPPEVEGDPHLQARMLSEDEAVGVGPVISVAVEDPESLKSERVEDPESERVEEVAEGSAVAKRPTRTPRKAKK